jgi:hypothetical protein
LFLILVNHFFFFLVFFQCFRVWVSLSSINPFWLIGFHSGVLFRVGRTEKMNFFLFKSHVKFNFFRRLRFWYIGIASLFLVSVAPEWWDISPASGWSTGCWFESNHMVLCGHGELKVKCGTVSIFLQISLRTQIYWNSLQWIASLSVPINMEIQHFGFLVRWESD